MNDWQIEFEYQRQRNEDEIEQFRLERLALQAQVYRPGLFARTMFRFANWMIATGKQLRKRYEVPTVNSSNPHKESFAH